MAEYEDETDKRNDGYNASLVIVDETPPLMDNKWIDPAEQMPDDGERVLVWFEYYRYGEYN